MGAILKANNLVKKYQNFEAVKGIDFSLNRHECLAMLGPNCAGKSSTMKMIYSAIPTCIVNCSQNNCNAL